MSNNLLENMLFSQSELRKGSEQVILSGTRHYSVNYGTGMTHQRAYSALALSSSFRKDDLGAVGVDF